MTDAGREPGGAGRHEEPGAGGVGAGGEGAPTGPGVGGEAGGGEEGVDLPSLPVRIVNVFISPGELFDRLRERPAWFGALAVAAVVAALSIYLIPPELWEEMARSQMAEVRARQGAEAAELPGGAAAFGRWMAVGGALVFMPVAAFVLAGVILFIFNFTLGRQATYRQYLSVVSHAYVIPALGSLALTPLRISAGRPELALSLGTFTESFLEAGFLQRTLGGVELFGVWAWIVIALGVSRLDARQTWGGAVVVLLVLKALQAVLFGGLLGSFGAG